MTMKGLLEHADEIEALMEDSPETPVILDHFGFCPADRPDDPSWERLLAMSKYPQVHVKVGGCGAP